jgi:transcriptional regulator with XRE-family HTH domain
MNHYHTPTSQEGLRLPYSGFVVGRLAGALQLKGRLREPGFKAGLYKTAQRYFTGERIEPETVVQILNVMVERLVPEAIVYGGGLIEEIPLRRIVHVALKNYAHLWDETAGAVNAHMFPVKAPRDLATPILRLVALDLGVRIGGWASLEYLRGTPIDWDKTWLDGGGFGSFLRARMKEKGLTIEELADVDHVDVSPQAVAAWRSGTSLPTSNNIDALAEFLATNASGALETELTLRILVAIENVIVDLKGLIGEERFDDLVRAIKNTAREIEKLQREFDAALPTELLASSNEQRLRGALWDLPIHGARCPAGQSMAHGLAQKGMWNQEAAADLRALSGDWSPRIAYWLSQLSLADRAPELVPQIHEQMPELKGLSRHGDEMLFRQIVEGQIRIGDIFAKPRYGVRISPPPFIKAMSRLSEAGIAASTGDDFTAIGQLRQAITHTPQDALLHFKLGGVLGQRAFQHGDPKAAEEALVECRVAATLDPEFGNARNEIGVILANMRRHEEAELAFAEAEPLFREHSHHWFCRGGNYLALAKLEKADIDSSSSTAREHRGYLEKAQAAYEKAVGLTNDENHIFAKAHLAAIHQALGDKRKSRDLAGEVHHVLGFDPRHGWAQGLNPWADIPPPKLPSGNGKVGRNDRCPCGSGIKFKRCCGQ